MLKVLETKITRLISPVVVILMGLLCLSLGAQVLHRYFYYGLLTAALLACLTHQIREMLAVNTTGLIRSSFGIFLLLAAFNVCCYVVGYTMQLAEGDPFINIGGFFGGLFGVITFTLVVVPFYRLNRAVVLSPR